jgi:hypothetical protein
MNVVWNEDNFIGCVTGVVTTSKYFVWLSAKLNAGNRINTSGYIGFSDFVHRPDFSKYQ